jgi:energy-coupling factor transporter ATP-binding protein EcfA2
MKDRPEQESARSQVENNSVTVGNLHVGSSVGGSVVIGSGNVVGYTSEQVSALISQISTTFQVKPFDGRCPYKGLDYFEEEDAELFFGREKLVEELVGKVKDSRTVFITGPSGSGKSSLVRAGLIHALRQDAVKGSDRWLYATIKPGREPFEALAGAFARLKDPGLGKYLRENANSAATLHECAESVLSERADQRLVLFLDQFEEVFTQLGKDKAQTFINLLAHAVTVEGGRVTILFSMRSDFVPNCATYPELNAILNQQFVQIGSMGSEELVSAIAQPALRVGLKIDPDLIAQIINDMKGEPGALPLMQFALKDLFDSRQETGGMIALTLGDYLQRGGIRKALQRHADQTFAGLDAGEQELARSIFTGLIEIGRGTQDTRRTALSNELIPAGVRKAEIESVVQKLANARLLTTDEVTVTISHEKLIEAWPWLKKLVDENRAVIALQNEISEHARQWDVERRDPSYLYTGARLANAREKLEANKLVLSGLARDFVGAGIQAEERKQREEERRLQKELEDARKLAATERRGRLITNGVLIAAILLAGLLGYVPIRNEIWRQNAMKTEMVHFEEGDYPLGDQRAKDAPDEYLVPEKYHISSFSIDTYPVTNERYNLCIKAGICSRPNDLPGMYEDEENLDKPVVNVNAIDAGEYCEWLGMRLPSEKEWELAAMKYKIVLPAGQPDTVSFFYEWTRSPYAPNDSEWMNTLISPPNWLTKKGGSLDQPLAQIATYRQVTRSTSSDETTGFRCTRDH